MIALLYNGQVWRTSLFDDEMDKCGSFLPKTDLCQLSLVCVNMQFDKFLTYQ